MLAQARVKTITIHTRKEAIAILEELKHKINAAYETETKPCLLSLLALVKLIFYLSPLPKLVAELNTVGTLPLSVFLENLLIKCRMVRWESRSILQSWTAALLYKMEECVPNCSLRQVKLLRQSELCDLNYNWEAEQIVAFLQSALEQSTRLNDFGLMASLVIFIRNFLVYCEQTSIQTIQLDWTAVVASLAKGSWILNNLTREESAICISHYLCLKNSQLSHIAIQNGIVNYLLHLLNSKAISESLGKKIIQFLTYLFFYGEQALREVDAASVEDAVSRFIQKYSRVLVEARNLMAILDKRCKINHEVKLQRIEGLFQEQGKIEEGEIIKQLSILSLYAHSPNLISLLGRSHHKLHHFLQISNHEHISTIIMEILSFAFRSGRLNETNAERLIHKINKVVSNKHSKERLNADRKRMLIDLIKILKSILQIRQFREKVGEQIRKNELVGKFWSYSDCTNYEYQKQLIGLGSQLGTPPAYEREKTLFVKLQQDFINKSKVSLNKATPQCCEEVKLLDELIARDNNSAEVSPLLPPVICSYVRPSSEEPSNLLQGLQEEEERQLRKRLNLACCKFIIKLMRLKQENSVEKAKLLELAASADQSQELHSVLQPFLKSHHIQTVKEPSNNMNGVSLDPPEARLKNTVKQYFADEHQDLNFIQGLTQQQIDIVLTEMVQYESESNILKTTRLMLMLSISKDDVSCLQIFNRFGGNIALMYNYLLSTYNHNHRDSIALIELLLTQFIKLFYSLLYNDQYLDYNYWMDILMTLDSYFEVALTSKRIALIQLVFEYLDLNKALSIENITLMMDKHLRKELLRAQALQSKGETLGYCLGSLLANSPMDSLEAVAMQHRENIIYLLKQSGSISTAKFIALFFSYCQDSTFNEYQLDEWVEALLSQLQQELDLSIITEGTEEATLKLRRVNQYVEVLFAMNSRTDLTVRKNILLAEENALIQTIKSMVHIVDSFQAQQFKRYLLEQLIGRAITTLLNLYRHNFRLISVRCADLLEYFESLLSMSSEETKEGVCELMRVLLLKKEGRMAECETYNSCKVYRESLSPNSQQHIYYCEMIEHILYEGGRMDDQEDAYFPYTPNNREPIPSTDLHKDTPSIHLPQHSIKKQQSKQSEPLFLQYASETSIPRPSLQSLASQEQQQQRQKEGPYNFTSQPSDSSQPSLNAATSLEVDQAVSDSRQGEFDGSTKLIEQLQKCWSEQELYEQIQLYLQGGKEIKPIFDRLTPIPTKRYYSLLIQLFLKVNASYSPSNDPSKMPAQPILSKIVECLPKECCELNDSFYEVLGSGVEGARLGAKVGNIGMRGLEIYCKRFMSALKMEEVSTYAELLSSAKSFEELKYMKTIRIYEVVNDKVLLFIDSDYPINDLCTLISQTCRYPPLCSAYDLVEPLSNYLILKDPPLRKEILATICHLCRHSERNKAKIQEGQFLSELVDMLQNAGKEESSTIAELLLMGVEDSPSVGQLYQKLALEEIVLRILRGRVESRQEEYCLFISLLRILEVLASLPQSAQRMLKRGFMGLCRPITAFSIKEGQFDLVGCVINTLRNMLEEMELALTKTFLELEKDGFSEYLLFIGPFLGRSHEVENYLNIYCKLVPNSATGKKLLEQLGRMLQVLSELARDQLLTQVLIQTWLKLVFLLAESNRFGSVQEVLRSNIFFSAAMALRGFGTVSEKIIGSNNRMMREVGSREELRALLIVHGYADFLVQVLRMASLPLTDYLRTMAVLSELSASRVFSSTLCRELFAVVIRRLEAGWREEMAEGSVQLLKSIRRKVEVTTEFGESMLDFFGRFLTQSSRVTSPEYYSISREVMCLLSHFLVFNEDIRALFRSSTPLLDILRNWLRISRALAYAEMPQAYKLLYYAMHCSQPLYLDLCGVGSKRLLEAEHAFERGWKCNLYRVNGSYKEAVLRMDKARKELVCYKHPDGLVKDKYRLALRDLLVIQTYPSEKDHLFLEGNFTRTSNIFQHKPVAAHCLTLMGLNEANYEVRELSIEALTAADLQSIEESARLLVSKWHEEAIEEESRAWQFVNMKH